MIFNNNETIIKWKYENHKNTEIDCMKIEFNLTNVEKNDEIINQIPNEIDLCNKIKCSIV